MQQEKIDLIRDYGIDLRRYDIVDLKIISEAVRNVLLQALIENNKK